MFPRRAFLRSSIAGASVFATGCLVGGPVPTDDFGDGDDASGDTLRPDWGSLRGDPANTGWRPSSHGPADGLTTAWEVPILSVIEEIAPVTASDIESTPGPTLDEGVIHAQNSPPVLSDSTVLWTVAYKLAETETGSPANETDSGALPPPDAAHVIAADQASGMLEWDYALPWERESGLQAFAPVVGATGVDVIGASATGLVIDTIDPASGERIDRLPTDDPGTPRQPVVADGTIYFVSDTDDGSFLNAVAVENAHPRWRKPVQPTGHGWGPSPDVAVARDRVWHVKIADEATIIGRDLTDGSVRTEIPLDLPASLVLDLPTSVMATPVIVKDTAYLAGGPDAVIHRDRSPLVAVDLQTQRVEWTYEPPPGEVALHEQAVGAMYGFPVAIGDLVVAPGVGAPPNAPEAKSYLFGIDRASGALEWALPDVLDPGYPPVAAGETVFAPTDTGAFAAISTAGELIDVLPIDPKSPLSGGPALGGGRLFSASYHRMVAIE